MKRYWLFAWVRYEADGGIHDLKGSFDTLEEAKEYFNKSFYDDHHIYDIIDNKVYFK